jgi:flagellar motor switch protein FliM
VLSQEEVDQLLGAISSGDIDQISSSNNLTQEDIDNLLKGSK